MQTEKSDQALCVFCGKELKPIERSFAGRTFCIGYEICGCPESVDEANRREASRKEDEKKRLIEERKKKLMRAGIPPRYLNAELSSENEHLFDHVMSGGGLYIQGPVGVGKTYLAMALAKRVIDAGKRVVATSSMDILARIRGTFSTDETEEDVFNWLRKPELLVIDDLGKDSSSEWTVSMIYRVIDDRSRNLLPVIITANFSKMALAERLAKSGDQSTAEAIVSRLFEMTTKVELTGEDRRVS